MKKIAPEPVRSVSIDVVVKDFKRYRNYMIDKNVNVLLATYCKNILLNQVVSENCSLNLSVLKLARVYGISHIITKKIQLKSKLSAGLVTDSSRINIQSVKSSYFFSLTQNDEKVTKLGGLELEFMKLEKLFLINKSLSTYYQPVGVLLHGPPGCGKTSFGKTLARKCGAAFYNVEASSLLDSDFGVGADNLHRVFEKAVNLTDEGPVILFLDEIDMLCPRQETASLGNKQLSAALMAELDAVHSKRISGLLVLAATNSIANVDMHLRRPGRFDQEILISVPTEAQRLSILEILTAKMHLAPDVSCRTLANMTPGFVGADLMGLCEEAVGHAESVENHPVLSMENFQFALHKTVPSLKKGSECVVDLRPVKWTDIGSLEDVKAEIRQSVEWPLKYPGILQSMDIPPAKGILLYGPPGCCKTTLVRAAATSCHVSFLSLSGAQVFSAYVGESERFISQAFQKARALAPSILFLDEIESIVGKRRSDTGHNRVQERVLSTLLNEMDGIGNRLDLKLESSSSQPDTNQQGLQRMHQRQQSDHEKVENIQSPHSGNNNLKVILVGATNRPDMLDPAILRPGRLDKHIYVPPPDEQARKDILHIFTSKMSCPDLDVDLLASRTNFYSGADLKNLCKEAGLQAVRAQLADASADKDFNWTVTPEHFRLALEAIKPSLSRELLQTYRK